MRSPAEAVLELNQSTDDQDDQDMPFLDHSFKSDSPFPEDSDSPPLQAPTPLVQHPVEPNSESAASSNADSAKSEQIWINDTQDKILLHNLYDVQMFSHCIQYNTTAAAANAIPTTLDGNLRQPLQSLYKVEKLVRKLSNLKTHTMHMCKNSCCTFDGLFVERDHCPFCKHPRRNRKGVPYKIFQPIPLAPCLQAMYGNPDMAKAMRYHTNYHDEPETEPEEPHENAENTPSPSAPLSSQLKDVFDGQHYCHLCQEHVKIPSDNDEGFKTLLHLYFDNE